MVKTALVIISNGVEDVEAVAPVDIMYRAGIKITIAGLTSGPVKAAYGNTIVPHITIDQVDDLYDAIVLPGGYENAINLAGNEKVLKLIHAHYAEGKLVAAICASPALVLGEAAGLIRGKRVTGFPGTQEIIENTGGEYTDELITVDGNIITGMGPGTAILFGLEIVEYLISKQVTDELVAKLRVRR